MENPLRAIVPFIAQPRQACFSGLPRGDHADLRPIDPLATSVHPTL